MWTLTSLGLFNLDLGNHFLLPTNISWNWLNEGICCLVSYIVLIALILMNVRGFYWTTLQRYIILTVTVQSPHGHRIFRNVTVRPPHDVKDHFTVTVQAPQDCTRKNRSKVTVRSPHGLSEIVRSLYGRRSNDFKSYGHRTGVTGS